MNNKIITKLYNLCVNYSIKREMNSIKVTSFFQTTALVTHCAQGQYSCCTYWLNGINNVHLTASTVLKEHKTIYQNHQLYIVIISSSSGETHGPSTLAESANIEHLWGTVSAHLSSGYNWKRKLVERSLNFFEFSTQINQEFNQTLQKQKKGIFFQFFATRDIRRIIFFQTTNLWSYNRVQPDERILN